jgi:hypothetical protein
MFCKKEDQRIDKILVSTRKFLVTLAANSAPLSSLSRVLACVPLVNDGAAGGKARLAALTARIYAGWMLVSARRAGHGER